MAGPQNKGINPSILFPVHVYLKSVGHGLFITVDLSIH